MGRYITNIWRSYINIDRVSKKRIIQSKLTKRIGDVTRIREITGKNSKSLSEHQRERERERETERDRDRHRER